MEALSCDVLVIGSGAAGLRAAISAREAGLDVAVLSKAKPGKSTCTWFSAGVMAGSSQPTSPETHLLATLQAGRGINQRELAETLVHEAPERLQELLNWGIRAEFHKGYLFSQGHPPVLGEELVRCLLARSKDLGIRFIGDVLVTDIVMEGGTGGICAYPRGLGEWLTMTCRALVLATGGGGALYLRHDNPKRMLGDGYRLAIEAGARLQDMEFVQFYPLCLAEPGLAPMVIPPRLADRGRLINSDGQEIFEKHGIEERPAAEKARDRLSRALFEEIHRNGQNVYLDLTGGPDDIWSKDPFSASVKHILGERYGALYRPIRVAPAAHHTMGGVVIDKSGATTVPGLFAAGEATGGLHGSNRMGGNALTETLVFGAIAGTSAAKWASEGSTPDYRPVLDRLNERKLKWEKVKPAEKGSLEKLLKVMWEDGGIIRNQEGLCLARDYLKAISIESFGSSPRQGSHDLAAGIELCSAARIAALIVEAALQRQESRGAHFREDFPLQDDAKWLGHLQVEVGSNGEDTWQFRP